MISGQTLFAEMDTPNYKSCVKLINSNGMTETEIDHQMGDTSHTFVLALTIKKEGTKTSLWFMEYSYERQSIPTFDKIDA